MTEQSSTKYDAFLLVSFGGPEGMDDVIPFLENVLRGKNVPRERMLAVSKHYQLFNGISPINEQNRKLIAALKPIIEEDGAKLPIYWGNRNWHPLLTDTVKQMAADGIKRAVAFATAGYSSYSSCRQYIENIENARALVGATAPQIDKIGPFYNHSGFIAANADELLIAAHGIPSERRKGAKIIFTAHSIPLSMADKCLYATQLLQVCHLIMASAQLSNPWQMAYQSRSGPSSQPWLEPDINHAIEEAAKNGIKDIIIAPIGFVSDHMEVLYDLDTQAKQLCQELSIGYNRAKTAGSHPKFISMIKELVDEKIQESQAVDSKLCSDLSEKLCFSNCCPIG